LDDFFTDNVLFLFFEAPIALKSHGIFSGKKVTSHPSVDKQLKEAGKLMFHILQKLLFLSFIWPAFDCSHNL